MTNKYILISVFAIIVKLAIAASTFHPDIRAFWLSGGLISSGNLLNLYDYLSLLPRDNFVVQLFTDGYLNYPPAIYFTHGLFNFIFSNILGLEFMNKYLIDSKEIFGNFDLNMQLLFTKLPYLIFDLLGAFFIIKLFKENSEKFAAFLLWTFNPVNLYATYMMGQFDIIPTVFVVLALLLVSKNQIKWAAVALGVGIAYKLFPIYLLLPLAFLGKDFRERFILVCLGFIPYVLTIIPFLGSTGFKTYALLTSQTMKSLDAQIAVSSGERILLFPLFLIGFYMYWYFIKNNPEDLWKKFLIIFFIFLIFTHYHPQWFLWVTPVLIIEMVKNNFKYLLLHLVVLFAYIFSVFLFEASLNVNLFAPAFPALYTQPTIWKILNMNIDLNYLRSIAQTLFTAAAVTLTYFNLSRRDS